MPTWRRFERFAYQSMVYEAEDVLTEVDDVDLFCLERQPGFHWSKCALPIVRQVWNRRSLWNDFTKPTIYQNPGLNSVRITQEYDLFVAICQNWWDVINVNAIKGWKDRCKTSVCWLHELWASWVPENRWWIPALDQFDHVILGMHGSVPSVSETLGRSCHWIPPAVDAIRFYPNPASTERRIDAYSLGTRNELLHKALLNLARSNKIFYLYDSFPSSSAVVLDHREHRELIANIVKRSRYFLVAPAKIVAPEETQGQIELGSRFFEGVAAGAILIGQKPDCESFRQLFDWPNAVIEFKSDGSNAADLISSLSREPKLLREISRRNTAEALRRHDWVYRWKSILEIAGLNPSPAMISREQRLKQLSGLIEDRSEAPDGLLESVFLPT